MFDCVANEVGHNLGEPVSIPMTEMEIEVIEIADRFVGPAGRDFTGPHQMSNTLSYLDVQEANSAHVIYISIVRAPPSAQPRVSAFAPRGTRVVP